MREAAKDRNVSITKLISRRGDQLFISHVKISNKGKIDSYLYIIWCKGLPVEILFIYIYYSTK